MCDVLKAGVLCFSSMFGKLGLLAGLVDSHACIYVAVVTCYVARISHGIG